MVFQTKSEVMRNDTDDGEVYQIGHLFADYGVESEAFASFGEVHRFTIEPKPNEYVAETTAIDLMTETPDVHLDLAVLHPKCTRWSDMPNVDPEEHENQIPRARHLAEEIADDVPGAVQDAIGERPCALDVRPGIREMCRDGTDPDVEGLVGTPAEVCLMPDPVLKLFL